MKSFWNLLRGHWPYIGLVLGLLGLTPVLHEPLSDLWSTLAGLIPLLREVPPATFVLVALLLFFASMSYIQFRNRDTPLTILTTDLSLTFHDHDAKHATYFCKQKLRANTDNVTGCHTRLWVDPPGYINQQEVEFDIYSEQGGEQHTLPNQDRYWEGDQHAWRVTHRFAPITRRLLMLGLNTVTRTENVVLHDAFEKTEESWTASATKDYRHGKMTIKIVFFSGRIPPQDKIKGIWISNDGVRDLDVRREDNRTVMLVIKKVQPGSTYKIVWRW